MRGDAMILEAALLWTIFSKSIGETILQYATEQDCYAAIERGLPYSNVPPKSELECKLRPNHNPYEQCSDGSTGDLRSGQTAHVTKHGHCRDCLDKKGQKVTSALCEAHGYTPLTPEDSDGHDPDAEKK